MATGNNPRLSNELARRTVRIRLDARTDRPWQRDEFTHQDLRGWTRVHRAELIWAALTLGRAWFAAGTPSCTKTLGMFEGWAKCLGGVLQVAGIDGFLGNVDAFYDESDDESDSWRRFIAMWWDRFGAEPVGVSGLWPLVDSKDEREFIPLPLGNGSERSQKTRLGRLLSERRDRMFGAYRIVSAGSSRRAQQWRLDEQPIIGEHGERGEHDPAEVVAESLEPESTTRDARRHE